MNAVSGRSRTRRVLRALAIVVLILLAAGLIGAIALNKPRPKGTAGPEAERLAQEMLVAVNAPAWRNTGAVTFTFGRHHHLWDRKRGYDRLEWRHHRVLLRISSRTGRAWSDNVELHGKPAEDQVRVAYSAWANDSFWLNPVVKIFDTGVTRSIIHDDKGRAQLLVEYASGGVTPGDAYLWLPGENGAPPSEWRMWVHVIPIGGLSASWENWMSLSTGAKVSTRHRIGPVSFELKDVAGASSLSELLQSTDDPFAALSP